MQCSRPKPSLTCTVSIFTVCWMLSCTSCVEVTQVLSARGLTHVPRNLSENLVTLDLSINNITSIEKDDFRTLKQVKEINLSYNQIQTLHERSFEDVYCLQVLDLSYNNIVHLPQSIFSRNQNLKDLYLKKNSLEVLGNFSNAQHILDSQSLIYLDVSFCNITYISCESLKGLPNLKTLKTKGNPLTQQNFEIKTPPTNLRTMETDLCNSSILEKFCCNLQEQVVPSSTRSRLNDANGEVEVDFVLVGGTILCVVVFIIVVTSYFLYIICKNRRENRNKDDSIRAIQNRPLPPTPSEDEGYIEPITPNIDCISSAISNNLQLNRNIGYFPLPSAENDSNIKTYTTTCHLTVETNHGSEHSLSGSTEYQHNLPYSPNMYIYSSSDVNEEDENNFPLPPMNGNYSISTSQYFSGANQPSTTGIPPPPCQRLGRPQDDEYLAKKKALTRPTPTSTASPTKNVTHFGVKNFDSGKLYVSSTSLELGKGSRRNVVV